MQFGGFACSTVVEVTDAPLEAQLFYNNRQRRERHVTLCHTRGNQHMFEAAYLGSMCSFLFVIALRELPMVLYNHNDGSCEQSAPQRDLLSFPRFVVSHH